jgi:hypothetical protein
MATISKEIDTKETEKSNISLNPIPIPISLPYTSTQLATGLGGVIGSDFRTAQNQLVFIEFSSGKLSSLGIAPSTAGYKVLGTGYNQPEDVKLSTDGVHAYVTERTGDLVKVALTSANRSSAQVIASGMTAPQQMFLDEAHNAAYVVEFATTGSLLKINLTTGVKTVITSALQNPIGVVLSSDLQYAYVSEQTTGPDIGRVSVINMSTAGRTTLVRGLTAPFFLTWADAAQDFILVPQRDPSNSILRVNVLTGTSTVLASSVPFRPSSVTIPTPGELLICCDSVIEELNYNTTTATGPLLMGIGLIPESSISSAGFATTSPSSLYYVANAPFGGELPIMVNFEAADTVSTGLAAYYQVIVDGVIQTNTWTVYVWNPVTEVYDPKPVPAQTIGTTPGCYPVHPVAELFNYQPVAQGGVVDSTPLTDGLHKIWLRFFNKTGNPLTPNLLSETVQVLVNNDQCVGAFGLPQLKATPPIVADSCGVLHYGSVGTGGDFLLEFTASQPKNFATFSIELVRGANNPVGTGLPSGAPVSTASSPISETVSSLMGSCTIAGFAAELYVAATMTNGISRQSQYDAQSLLGFVLTT